MTLHAEQREMTIFTKCYMKEGDLVTRCVAGETIIVPVRAHVAELDSIFTLNEVGTMIWQLIDGRTRVGQIAEATCRAYEIGLEEAAEDLRVPTGGKQLGSVVDGHDLRLSPLTLDLPLNPPRSGYALMGLAGVSR